MSLLLTPARQPVLRRLAAGLFLGAVALASAPAFAAVVAKVDGVEITDDDVKIALEDIGASLPRQWPQQQREAYVVTYLIDLRIAARKAAVDKLTQGPDFERRLGYYRDKAAMEALLDKIRKDAVTEVAVKQTYDDAAKRQPPEAEVKASHILVPTEEEAKAALKRVQGGEDFAKVAKEISKDPGSPGGDLGWFVKGRMVPEFAEAAFGAKPGDLVGPIKTQFGWHIIKVEDRREKAFPPLESVRDQVERFLGQKAQQDAIEKMRAAAKIDRVEPAPAPAPTPAPVPAPK